jgi:hypothetical protein
VEEVGLEIVEDLEGIVVDLVGIAEASTETTISTETTTTIGAIVTTKTILIEGISTTTTETTTLAEMTI